MILGKNIEESEKMNTYQTSVNIKFVAHMHYFHHKKIDRYIWFADT
jgi:predicted metallo-beta-lactamase superfamily hydrolase